MRNLIAAALLLLLAPSGRLAAEDAAPTKKRYLSPYDQVNAWVAQEKSALVFAGKTRGDFERWRKQFAKRLRGYLGRVPERVPLDAEVLEKQDCGDYTREKVVFNTEKYASVVAYVLVPKELKPGERRPAVLACHGHGRGKADVCGVAASPEERKTLIEPLNYDYAVQFVRRGYVVIAPDWRGFGERQSPAAWARAGRDPCNVHFIKGALLGFNLLAHNLWDLMKCVDVLETLPYVERERIGAMGLSGGGAHVMHFSALEPRIRATDVICALNSYRAWGIGIDNFCGTQFLPGLFQYGDHAEICGLICPRPLLVENGGFDYGFPPEDSLKAYARLQQIYQASGVPENLEQDFNYGGHQYYGHKAPAFFAKHLGEA